MLQVMSMLGHRAAATVHLCQNLATAPRPLLYVDSHPTTLPFYEVFNAGLLFAFREGSTPEAITIAASLAGGQDQTSGRRRHMGLGVP